MKNLAFLLLLSCALPAISQNTVFAPKGAVWRQTPYSFQYYPFNLFTWTADEDTLLDGWNARAIHCNRVTFFNTTRIDSMTRFTAVQGDKVFWRAGGQFVLLFDFGAKPGDTITSAISGPNVVSGCGDGSGPFRYRIDSVGTVLVSGQVLRKQFVSTVFSASGPPIWMFGLGLSGQVVERLGVVSSMHWYGVGPPCVLAGLPSFIRCYSDGEVVYANPKWEQYGKPCDFTSSAAEPSAEPFTISPNPASGVVRLPFEPEEVRLSNSLGQTVSPHPKGTELDVSALPPGIWFLILEKDGRRLGARLVVQAP